MAKGKRLASFASFTIVLLAASSAFAQGAGAADNLYTMYGMFALAAGLAIGVAGAGAAIGQGRAAASALEGIARNPGVAGKMQTPLLLSLAFMEALGIFAFVIAFIVSGKIQLDPAGLTALVEVLPK